MPKKLSRICIINPQGYVQDPPPLGKTDTGGQTIYILELAKALGAKGIKVDIFTRQFEGLPQEEQIAENVTIVRIACGSANFVQKEKLFELMPEFVENIMFYTEQKKKTYSLIHSHYWDGGYAGLLLSKMLDVPHVHTPHSLGKLKKLEMIVEDLPPQKLKPAYRYHVRIAIEQKIYMRAQAIVVICETSLIQILQHYMVDFEKVQVIYPGIDTSHFGLKASNYDKDIQLEYPAIFTVSRFVPAKGLDRVIEAIALIKNKAKFHLYMGGSHPTEATSDEEKLTRDQLTKLVTKHQLKNRVHFVGYVDHTTTLPAYYRKADIFILPSRYEPFGLTALEAMACGTAPIVSHVAGSKEVIVDGLNGLIVNTHDRQLLADSILKLIQDEKLRKKIAANAAFTIKENYSWEKVVEKFIALYEKVLK